MTWLILTGRISSRYPWVRSCAMTVASELEAVYVCWSLLAFLPVTCDADAADGWVGQPWRAPLCGWQALTLNKLVQYKPRPVLSPKSG